MRREATAALLWRLYAGLVLVFMLSPLLLVVLFSFNDSALTSLPITGLTFHWYRKLLANRSFLPALYNSVVVGFVVASLSVVIGTAAALALARARGPAVAGWLALLGLPMLLPALLVGIALLAFFVRFLDLRLGLHTVILAQLVIAQPLVILVVHARLSSFDWAVVDSARDLGASPAEAFRTVTLPIIGPTLVGAFLMALAVSLDDFVITFFTIGAGNTLPTLVWGLVRTSLDPTINAMATLLIALSVGSTLVALKLARYRG